MNPSNLQVVKTRTLILEANKPSEEVVLVDNIGGDIFLTFELRYVTPGANASTRLEVLDAFHGKIVIEGLPDTITRPSEYVKIGTYAHRPLYLDFNVQPQIGVSGQHTVVITFLAEKEEDHGNR